jgi:hypothetical protein
MAVRVRELFGAMVEASVSFKKWQRNWIVNRRLHAIGAQICGELVAARMPDSIEMVDICSACCNRGTTTSSI